MPLKPGDKVKFLNASGGGIVSRIIDNRMVSVLTEDGFDIPSLISELIPTNPNEPAARFFDAHYKIDLPKPSGNPVEAERVEAEPVEAERVEAEPSDDRHRKLPARVTSERKSEDLYLAFVPHDQKWLISGPVDIMLINNSSYDILYNVFTRNALGHYTGMDYGSIFPDSKLVLATINREQLTHWTDGCLQFLFHKDQDLKILPPFNSEFRIDGKRFYKEGYYREHSMIQARGIVVKVLSLTDYMPPAQQAKDAAAVPAQVQPGSGAILQHQVAPREAVVDLHIHELVEDPANLEKSDILEFQKNYFLKCMDSAMAAGFRKVTFIHGIGNGVLRNVITDLLKKQEGVEIFDAPLAKFGTGALEVRFRQNPGN